MTLNSPLTDVKGVGEALAAKFVQLGLRSVGDLIAVRIERSTGINPGIWLRTWVSDSRDGHASDRENSLG